MLIAEAAAASRLTIDTIRYYERSGMLPTIARGPDGHRRFSREDVDWMTVLFWLRATGMTMRVMRRYAMLVHAGNHTIPERKTILQEHGRLLARRREELDHCEKLLAYKLAAYDEVEQRKTA